MTEQVEAYLSEIHCELRDNRDDRSTGQVMGAINALHAVGLLTDVEGSLWHKAIQFCPGHDGEGGRSWCAYCGDLEVEEG